MNDNEYIIKLLRKNTEILAKIYNLLSHEVSTEPEINFTETQKPVIDLEKLAYWIGETYCTTRPDVSAISQYDGLLRMSLDYRFEKFLLNWLRRKKEMIPAFWSLTLSEQKEIYHDAIIQYKDLIIRLIQPKLISVH